MSVSKVLNVSRMCVKTDIPSKCIFKSEFWGLLKLMTVQSNLDNSISVDFASKLSIVV